MRHKTLFNGLINDFIKEHKLIRRGAAVAGLAVGLFFIGRALGWW